VTDHALDRGTRTLPSAALSVAAAIGGLILVAGAVTAGAAAQAIAVILAAVSAAVIIWRPEWGVFVLTSTFFLSYPEALTGSGRFTINNIVGLLLAGVFAVRVLISRRFDVLESPILRMLLVLWFLLFVNRLVADSTPPFASMSQLDLTEMRATDFVGKFWFVFFVIAFIRARWQVTVFGLSLVLFVMITAPNAIVNALTAWDAVNSGNIERMRAAADFGIMAARNANRLAFLCDLTIAIIACAMLRLRWRWLNVAGSIAIALLIVTVFLSASRSGLINLLLMGVYFFWRAGIPMRRLVISTLVTGVLVLLVLQLVPGQYLPFMGSQEDVVRRAVSTAAARSNIPSAYLERITRFVMGGGAGQEGVDVSTDNRAELALTGLRMFVDHPIVGVGFGNFRWKSIIDYNNPHVSALHNSYILALTEGGLMIFIAYVALFVVVFKVLAQARRHADERPEVGLGWLVQATQVMFGMFLVFSAFADCWHEAYLFFLVALAAVLARLYAPAPQSEAA
jgi:hypothetical protein